MALDAAKGEMLAASLPPDADAAANTTIWKAAYADGVRPGAAVGGGLFPCLSGYGGAKVRVNLGLDAARPLRLAPPTSEFRPAGQARAAGAAAEVSAAAPPLAREVSRVCVWDAWDVWAVTRICVYWLRWWCCRVTTRRTRRACSSGWCRQYTPLPLHTTESIHIRVTSSKSLHIRVTSSPSHRRLGAAPQKSPAPRPHGDANRGGVAVTLM